MEREVLQPGARGFRATSAVIARRDAFDKRVQRVIEEGMTAGVFARRA